MNIIHIIDTTGAIYTYFIADRATKSQAKHDAHGFSEPEARLWTALPGLFLATTGLWTFGFSAQNPAPKAWLGLQFGSGMLAFGLMQAPSIGFTYVSTLNLAMFRRALTTSLQLIEAYNAISGDCFVVVTCLRAIIAFCWTFFVGTWSGEAGPAEPFGIFAMLMGIFALLTIPMMVWGKRTRIATARWLPEKVDH